MRILFLSAWFPEPPSNGSRLRVHHLLRALADHEVTLLSFADEPDADPDAAVARGLCRHVRVLPRIPFAPHAVRSRLAYLGLRPRSVTTTFSAAMAQAVAGEAATGCDVIVASQLACAAYAPWFGPVPALLEELELGWLLGDGAVAGWRWRVRARAAKYRRYLHDLMPRFRACTVVSETERLLLRDFCGEGVPPVHVVPNAVPVDDYPAADPLPDTVIFTGSLHYPPNHQAMVWFLERVWPRVLAARPAARVIITGAAGERRLPAAPRVEQTGFVEDIRPLLARSCVAVAPILFGGGTRVKILEAMAAHTPVVATRKGAEGIAAESGRHLIIADESDEFAAAVIALLADPSRRARLADQAHALVAAEYDWRQVGPRFEALVRSLAAAAR